MTAIACPVCETVNNGHTAADLSSAVPADGDVAVCAGCLQLLVYTEGATKQRCLTALELAQLEPVVRVSLLRARSTIARWRGGDLRAELQGATPP